MTTGYRTWANPVRVGETTAPSIEARTHPPTAAACAAFSEWKARAAATAAERKAQRATAAAARAAKKSQTAAAILARKAQRAAPPALANGAPLPARGKVQAGRRARAKLSDDMVRAFYARMSNGEVRDHLAVEAGINPRNLSKRFRALGLPPHRRDIQAQARGKNILSAAQLDTAEAARARGDSWHAIATALGCSVRMLQRRLKERAALP